MANKMSASIAASSVADNTAVLSGAMQMQVPVSGKNEKPMVEKHGLPDLDVLGEYVATEVIPPDVDRSVEYSSQASRVKVRATSPWMPWSLQQQSRDIQEHL